MSEDVKFKIEGDHSSGMRAVTETREAMDRLRGGTESLSRAMSGDLVGAAAGGMNALRGLWGLIVSNPWIALAAGVALVVSKLRSMASEAKAAEKAAIDAAQASAQALGKAAGDTRRMDTMERVSFYKGKKDTAGLSREIASLTDEETDAETAVKFDPLNQAKIAQRTAARYRLQIAQQARDEIDAEARASRQAQREKENQEDAQRGMTAEARLRAAKDASMQLRPVDEQVGYRKGELRDAVAAGSGLREGSAAWLENKAKVQEITNELYRLGLQLVQRRDAENKAADAARKASDQQQAQLAAKQQSRTEKAFDFFRSQLPDDDQLALTRLRIKQLGSAIGGKNLKPEDRENLIDQLFSEQMKEVDLQKKIRAAKEKTLRKEEVRGSADYLQDLRNAVAGGMEDAGGLSHTKRADAFRARLGPSFSDRLGPSFSERLRPSAFWSSSAGHAPDRATTRTESLQVEMVALAKAQLAVMSERLGVGA